MEIKAIRMFDGGFMNQQFAFGGEGKEGTDEQIIYRSSLQNFLIDTREETGRATLYGRESEGLYGGLCRVGLQA